MAAAGLRKALSKVTGRGKQPRVPPFRRVYAIGDIHGRADLFDRLHEMILADRAAAGAVRPVLVYLGDYVDRGPDSAGIVERLVAPPPGDFDRVCLIGNHEQLMLDFLAREGAGLGWLMNGGDATLRSYGVPIAGEVYRREELAPLQAALRQRLPATHRAFLDALDRTHREGDYLFVHAGIRPGVPLDRQDEKDLIWIREDFLDSAADHGAVVVHGHSIRPKVEMRRNRIGLDTGAYASGTLTCLVLQDDQRSLLQT